MENPGFASVAQAPLVYTVMPDQHQACWIQYHRQVAPQGVLSLLDVIECLSVGCFSCVLRNTFHIRWIIAKSPWRICWYIVNSDRVKETFDLGKRLEPRAEYWVFFWEIRETVIWDFCDGFPLENFGVRYVFRFLDTPLKSEIDYSGPITCWTIVLDIHFSWFKVNFYSEFKYWDLCGLPPHSPFRLLSDWLGTQL